jgi:hypothetical protein
LKPHRVEPSSDEIPHSLRIRFRDETRLRLWFSQGTNSRELCHLICRRLRRVTGIMQGARLLASGCRLQSSQPYRYTIARARHSAWQRCQQSRFQSRQGSNWSRGTVAAQVLDGTREARGLPMSAAIDLSAFAKVSSRQHPAIDGFVCQKHPPTALALDELKLVIQMNQVLLYGILGN